MPARFFSFIAFICLIAGIILGNLVNSYLFFACLFILVAFFSWLLSKNKNKYFSGLGAIFLIICLGALAKTAASGLNRKDEFLKNEIEATIKVISLPVTASNRNSFLATVYDIEGRKRNFRVRVFDYSKKLTYLNRYRLKANLSRQTYRGKVFYSLWVKKAAEINKLPLPFWEKAIKAANSYCLEVFRKNCNLAASNFLASIFLGRRELIKSQQEYMQKAGLAHLLAISGLHIGLISLILFYLLRFFNIKFKVSLLISCFFLIFYAAAVGPRPSVLRAVFMYLIFALGFLLKRKSDLLNSLGLAGLVLLLFSPGLVYDLGFQLSFLAVLGIIVGFKFFPAAFYGNLVINYVKQILLCSFFVFVFLLPLISHYFGRIHLMGIAYNVVLIPFFALILFLAFILIIISPVSFAAQSLGAVISWLVYLFQNLTRFLGLLPISYFSYSFSLTQVALYYFCLLLAVATLTFLRQINYTSEV